MLGINLTAKSLRILPKLRFLTGFHWILGLGAALTLTLPIVAQTTSSPTPRATQFVFVIDDSGSMRGFGGEPAADPDRLAVFSVQALLTMLDPRDEASLVRLNAAGDNEAPPPIRPLSENRDALERLLSLDSKLARYDGGHTPCRSALETVERLLQRAHRQNVAQVVMFLTDGRCTPSETETPQVEAFLDGLESHENGLLRFYLLRFEGRNFSRELARLAQATGGQVIEVGGDDPTEILEPFADALTRSQGYEAELITPDEQGLAAHRGARRVRLLAVAPGEGPRLDFRISDLSGRRPDLLGRTRHGLHRYPGGRIYRYAAIDYRPTTTPMTVDVENGDHRWKVVAVPEYRLALDLKVRRGTCADPGPELRHGTESGTSVCVVMRLINEQGRAVEREGLGNLEAYVHYGSDIDSLQKQPATPEGETAVYTFERRRLDPGDHVFQPTVELHLPGRDEPVRITAPPAGLEASTLRIQPRPASLDFGSLRPGEESSPQSIVFGGNFSPTPATLEVADRRSLPSCITFTLSGRREAQTVSAGTEMKVVAWVAPYCGPDDIQRDFTPILRLVFANEDSETFLPAAEIGTRLTLDYRIERPADLTFELRAGESSQVPLRIGGNQVEPFDLEVVLESPEHRDGWPKDDLELGFSNSDGELRAEDGPVAETTVTFSPGSQTAPLRLRVNSGKCCDGGRYETALALLPSRNEAYASPLPEPLVVPVMVEVEAASFWACRGDAILWGILLLALLLLAIYLYLMFRNSTFLDKDRLAEALTPLRWDGYGGTQRDTRSNGEVRAMVARGLSWRDRLLAWLKANPLIFGLPGGSYRETVELFLQPQRSIDRSSLRLIPQRNLQRRIEAEPDLGAGSLFAQAQGRGGIEFYGVPLKGRLGRLVPQRLQHEFNWGVDPRPEEPTPLQILRLRRREQLLHPLPTGDRLEGRAAGWQVG